jgi:hypothetical protein
MDEDLSRMNFDFYYSSFLFLSDEEGWEEDSEGFWGRVKMSNQTWIEQKYGRCEASPDFYW